MRENDFNEHTQKPHNVITINLIKGSDNIYIDKCLNKNFTSFKMKISRIKQSLRSRKTLSCLISDSQSIQDPMTNEYHEGTFDTCFS